MNFKKCTSLFLAFLLLVSNAGLAFNVHYCGDQIDSISLKTTTAINLEKACCTESDSIEESCCKDKVVNFEKKSDNTILKIFSVDSPYCELSYHVHNFIFSLRKEITNLKSDTYFCETNAPPLFKLYSQYIFYA